MNRVAFQTYGTKKLSLFQSVWDTTKNSAVGVEIASTAATTPLPAGWTGTNLLTGGYTHTSGNTDSLLVNNLTPIAGQSYRIICTLSSGSTGSVLINWGGMSSIAISATTTITLTPINITSKLSITPSSNFVGTVSLSIKQSSSATNQIQLPISIASGKSIWVDWGDGQYSTMNSANVTANRIHTYAASGEYPVRVFGDDFSFGFGNGGFNDRLKIKSISSWGKLKLQSFSFNGCSNVTMSGITDIPDLTGVTSLSYIFSYCALLTTVGRINEWNTSSVTNMSNMFNGSQLFNDNIGSWNVSACTTFASMFEGARNFNQPIGNWNVSNVTTMRYMFQGGSIPMSFNQNIGSWDVRNVVDFDYFMGSANAKSSFNNGGSPDINNWIINTSANVNMGGMFTNCTDFNQPLNLWNTSRVTNMGNMFSAWVSPMKFNNGYASGVANQLPWNTSNVTNMNSMFGNNPALNSNLGTGTTPWDVSKVTTFASMFNGASNFNNGDNTAPINNWNINTTAAVNMASMFQSASNFNRDVSSWNVSRVTNMSGMFQAATSFNQPLAGWERITPDVSSLSNVTTMSNMFYQAYSFNQPVGNWNVSNVTTMQAMFSGATAFNQDISSWNVGKVTIFTAMFSGATAFNNGGNSVTNLITSRTGINGWNIGTTAASVVTNQMFQNTNFNRYIGDWDVSKVTAMGNMFLSNGSFNQDLSKWNVGSVTSMEAMFYNADAFTNGSNTNINPVTGLTGINGWNINTSPAASVIMLNMFASNNAFNQPIGSWNVSRVTNMGQMFDSAIVFNQSLSNWERVLSPDTSTLANVTTMQRMFNNARDFNQNIGSWNVSNVTNFSGFMESKTPVTGASPFSSTNLDAIYNGWIVNGVKPNTTSPLSTNISFGTAKYTSAGTPGKNVLLAPPNNWIIQDGGI